MPLIFFSILLCSFDAAISSAHSRHPRASDQCHSLVDGPFRFCSTKGGYNTTFEYPDFLTDSMLELVAETVSQAFNSLKNCSQNGLLETMICHYVIPQCSEGKRVYPCKRVCGELLKQCEEKIEEPFIGYFIASCHVLPDELSSSGKCFEPPNFSTNDSIKGPLDRGCQELIIPACKNLAVSQQTLISVDNQKKWYFRAYNENYTVENAETDFPPDFLKLLKKYPKCKENLKKMLCGEIFPPCFPSEGEGHYSICRSICDDIVRDCPEFFRNDFISEAEYCALLGKENTSHGFCKRTAWPPPFSWARYIPRDSDIVGPTDKVPSKATQGNVPSKATKGVKVWPIVVSVVVALIIVGLIVLAAIWMKWRWNGVPRLGYKKQEDDMAPLETAAEL